MANHPTSGPIAEFAAQSSGWRETADTEALFMARMEASMAGGWTRDGAEQDQIDDTVKGAVELARTPLPSGERADECSDCGDPISAKRHAEIPGTRACVACQAQRDTSVRHSAINRRGSKDSQLR